ncbi:uncharacterized protein LOC117212545 [Bombus bifarius]|uniref:Uncharacterized protein LOC117212545 n=1 Tax=Bombus bifarius TaxID=103933 RepID=A0A6P8NFV3_9HYME|nr:uncharacterized protein LOC117154101 [Bombus vancouverensis nearcticus]XP_033313330.1 uncharacterized protein LOC117212545 [Bombus bifarius]
MIDDREKRRSGEIVSVRFSNALHGQELMRPSARADLVSVNGISVVKSTMDDILFSTIGFLLSTGIFSQYIRRRLLKQLSLDELLIAHECALRVQSFIIPDIHSNYFLERNEEFQ